MATEAVDRRAAHRRGIKVTTAACLGGVVAGAASASVATGPGDRFGVVVLLGVVLAELVVLRLLGVDVEDFSTKDHLYVVFMTFSLWFISWTVLLTTGAS